MSPEKRLVELDHFRGLALWLMVAGNFLAGVAWVPALFKHAPDVGLTIADTIAPFFIFAIGLTYRQAFARRFHTQGVLPAYLHYVKRYATLIAIGFVLSSGEIWVNVNQGGVNWGVLQSIGIAGLTMLLFVRKPPQFRLISGIILLAIYQYLYARYWHQVIINSPHGGWQGALGWTAMLIITTVIADYYYARPLKRAVLLPCLLLVTGLICHYFIPISKNRVSPSYVLVGLGISGLIFTAFAYHYQKSQLEIGWLSRWGKNPLIIFLLHNFLLALFVLPPIPQWYREAKVWLTICQVALLLFCIDLLMRHLEKRRLIISL